MSDEDVVNQNRRHFLTMATAVTGGVGVAMVAVPFLSSLKPSARAQAIGAPVEVPIGALEDGEMVRVVWRGRLVYVVKRDEQMLASLASTADLLDDPTSEKSPDQQPAYAVNEARSIRPEYLVVEGVCTHLGCAPTPQFEVGPAPDWFGGFFCPCHGSKFDLSGRVYKGVPAPTNLRIPPYRYASDSLIIIGEEGGVA